MQFLAHFFRRKMLRMHNWVLKASKRESVKRNERGLQNAVSKVWCFPPPKKKNWILCLAPSIEHFSSKFWKVRLLLLLCKLIRNLSFPSQNLLKNEITQTQSPSVCLYAIFWPKSERFLPKSEHFFHVESGSRNLLSLISSLCSHYCLRRGGATTARTTRARKTQGPCQCRLSTFGRTWWWWR